MKLNQIKLFVIALIALPVLALAILAGTQDRTVSATVVSDNGVFKNMDGDDDDVAAQYKKTCALCHKATAEKFFEPSKMDEVLVEIVLKGKKAEKPPNMPGYEAKGMTEAQAKLLVSYMRQMRTPASQ